jgi:hypothetical protein
MWACRRQACEGASRCRSTLNNELIFLLGRVLSIGFDVADPQPFQFTRSRNKILAFFAPRTRKGFVPASAASANRSTSSREEQTRQGLGKYTRIRRGDYPKLTRVIKRIPSCWGHVAALISGKVADSETNQGSFRRQATTIKPRGRAACRGSTQRERIVWQIGHSTGQLSVVSQRVAGAGAIIILDVMRSTKQACLTRERSY